MTEQSKSDPKNVIVVPISLFQSEEVPMDAKQMYIKGLRVHANTLNNLMPNLSKDLGIRNHHLAEYTGAIFGSDCDQVELLGLFEFEGPSTHGRRSG